jgi:hypothetical protein
MKRNAIKAYSSSTSSMHACVSDNMGRRVALVETRDMRTAVFVRNAGEQYGNGSPRESTRKREQNDVRRIGICRGIESI